MKTLGLVVPSLTKGGGVPSVARFIKDAALRSGEFELKIVSLSMSSNDPCSLNIRHPSSWARGVLASRGEWQGLPFTHVGAWFGELEFQRYRPRNQLAEALKDCHVIQVVGGYPAWANAVLGLGKPVALQVATLAEVERRRRDSTSVGIQGWWRRKMTSITDRFDYRALRMVDGIQVENSWMLDHARKVNGGRDIDIQYAPPGVDTELYRPIAARDLYDDPYILCVGRLVDPRKNIGLLLEAYAQLPEPVRNRVRLVLAGASGPPESFWRRARELGLGKSITYVATPSTEKLVHLYQRASVFALPSDEEGLGIVLLEAMACGIPVVSTRCGGPDDIIADGKDGYLVPTDDTFLMSRCLNELLSNSALNIAVGKSARHKIVNKFDQQITGDMFIEMWRRLARSGS